MNITIEKTTARRTYAICRDGKPVSGAYVHDLGSTLVVIVRDALTGSYSHVDTNSLDKARSIVATLLAANETSEQ